MNLVLDLRTARFVTGAGEKPLSGGALDTIGARMRRITLPQAEVGEKISLRVFEDRTEVHSTLRGRVSVIEEDFTQPIADIEKASAASERMAALPEASSSASDMKGSWAKKVAQSKHMHKASSVASNFFKAEHLEKSHSKFSSVAPYMKFTGVLAVGAAAVGLATSYESYQDAKQSGASKTLQKEHLTATVVNASKLSSYSVKTADAGFGLMKLKAKALSALKVIGKIAGGIAGIASLVSAGLGTWKLYKKDCFFRRLEESTKDVKDTAEKAKRIWSAYQKEIAIDEQKVLDKLEDFKDLDDIEYKLGDLQKTFTRGLGYRLETVGHALDSARSWVKGKLGYDSSPRNARYNKEQKITAYMEAIREKLSEIDQQDLDPQEAEIRKHDLLDAAKYKLEREIATFARAKDIASVTSDTFANMLVAHQGVVNVENRLHQYKIIRIHNRLVKDYEDNRSWAIAGLIIDYVSGIMGVVGLFVPGGLIITIITNLLVSHWFGSLMLETFGDRVKRALGIEVPPSFDSDIKRIYANMEGRRFTRIVA